MINGNELLHQLGNLDAEYNLRRLACTDEEITRALIEMDGEISLNYYSSRTPRLVSILLKNPALLNKCDGNALSWLLENPVAAPKIMSDNSLIQKTEEASLAILVKEQGISVWNRIKAAGKDNFADGNHLCWAAEGQEAVALDIIQDDEKVKKIAEQPLVSLFLQHEKVALALINNPIFMQTASSRALFTIALQHQTCAQQLFNKLDELPQLQQLTNHRRELLRNKYPFWTQENRALNAEELQILARDETRIQAAIQIDPQIVNQQDEHGRTLLHYVAINGFAMGSTSLRRIFEVLWIAPINFEIQDENGNTPLHIVAGTVHERVSSSFILPSFYTQARERQANLLVGNHANQTFWDVINANRDTEYFTSRGRIHPRSDIIPPRAAQGPDNALQAAINASFEMPAGRNHQITPRDIVSVNEFLKAELLAEHGLFIGELRELSLDDQIALIRYLIAMHSDTTFQRNRTIEDQINDMDDYKVMLSIENAIKVVTRKEEITAENIAAVRAQYLINLRCCERELLPPQPRASFCSATLSLRVASGISCALGAIALFLAFFSFNVATLGTASAIVLTTIGIAALLTGGLGLFVLRNKNSEQSLLPVGSAAPKV